MSEILENLYLGSIRYAKDQNFLQKYSITHILIAAKALQQYFPKNINYLQFPITDNPSTIILSFIPEAIKFIDSVRKSKELNQNILVHCLGGRSRSVTIVTSYIMFEKGLNAEDALDFVKKKHTFAFPNPGFLKQLAIFEICIEKYYKVIENDKEKVEGKVIMKEECKYEENEEECKISKEKKKIGEKTIDFNIAIDTISNKINFEALSLVVKSKIEKNFLKK